MPKGSYHHYKWNDDDPYFNAAVEGIADKYFPGIESTRYAILRGVLGKKEHYDLLGKRAHIFMWKKSDKDFNAYLASTSTIDLWSNFDPSQWSIVMQWGDPSDEKSKRIPDVPMADPPFLSPAHPPHPPQQHPPPGGPHVRFPPDVPMADPPGPQQPPAVPPGPPPQPPHQPPQPPPVGVPIETDDADMPVMPAEPQTVEPTLPQFSSPDDAIMRAPPIVSRQRADPRARSRTPERERRPPPRPISKAIPKPKAEPPKLSLIHI